MAQTYSFNTGERSVMRISRPCYDKYHRCPGWVGGGNLSAKVDKCDSGYITYNKTFNFGKYILGHYFNLFLTTFGRCSKCDVIVLPYQIRYIDPTWIKSEIQYKFTK